MMTTALPAADAAVLSELVKASRPFLKITGADRVDWQRPIKDRKNPRIGPWKWRARFDTLDAEVWRRKGEALYFATDGQGSVRVVGETIENLAWRWKEVPMFCVRTGTSLRQRGLFHTTGWPGIEAELDQGIATPYTVSAIFRDDLNALCRRVGGPLATAMEMPQTHKERLSFHVETWVCRLKRRGLPLWNTRKT
jgi:hypothetical protein